MKLFHITLIGIILCFNIVDMYLAKSEKQNQSIYDYFDLKFVTICIHIIFKEMTH